MTPTEKNELSRSFAAATASAQRKPLFIEPDKWREALGLNKERSVPTTLETLEQAQGDIRNLLDTLKKLNPQVSHYSDDPHFDYLRKAIYREEESK